MDPHRTQGFFFTDRCTLSTFYSWRHRFFVRVLTSIFCLLAACATASVWGFVSGWMNRRLRNRAPLSTTWCRRKQSTNSTCRCIISTPTSTTGQSVCKHRNIASPVVVTYPEDVRGRGSDVQNAVENARDRNQFHPYRTISSNKWRGKNGRRKESHRDKVFVARHFEHKI